MSAAYFVQAIDPIACAQILQELWLGSLTESQWLEPKHAWFYQGHVTEVPRVQALCHGDEAKVVGVGAVGARMLMCEGQALRAGIRVDFAVAPQHRTLFPAMQLQRAVAVDGLAHDDLLYGVPNASAEKVLRRIGFNREISVVRYARIVGWGAYLSKVMPGWMALPCGKVAEAVHQAYLRIKRVLFAGSDGDWLSQFDERFDRLWQQCAQGTSLIGERSGAYLHWRFGQIPYKQHDIFALTHRGSGRLQGYAVIMPDGDTWHIQDLLVEGHDPLLIDALITRLSIEAHNQGVTSLSFCFAGPQSVVQALQDTGCRPRESRPVFVSWPDASEHRALLMRDWYFTAADEDQ